MNWLKKLYSYVREMPVISVESKYTPDLKVTYLKGRYVLGSGNIMYSFEDEYSAFRITFDYLKPEKRDIKKVLILGYGLGSIPLILNRRHKMNCDYTAVELDPAVIALAKDYSKFPARSHIKLICGDALEYVQSAKEQFDLIVVDIFIMDDVPEEFTGDDFLQRLRLLMAPGGLILYNRLYDVTKRKIATDGYFQYTFQKEFPESYGIDTNGNLVMVFDDRVKKIAGMR